jgi:hypothetical protein
MTKHHTDDRSIEHAKTRDTMAHRLTSPDAPESGHRSTRGFAAVKGTQPAVDIQPRHGGKAKGGVVAHSWGNTKQQIAEEGTKHVVYGAGPAYGLAGNPDASSANPLDLMTSSQAGKRLPIPVAHPHMTANDPERGTYDPASSGKVLAEAVVSGATKLPATVKED